MPDFRPFRGTRYALAPPDEVAELSAVAAPPYDVIDEEGRASLEAADPHNAVRLILPREAADGTDRYRAAAALLQEWRRRGVLAVDPEPRFYGYRMSYPGADGAARSTLGVLGALALPDDGAGDAQAVLPHERTMPKAKSDRLALLQATRTNLDPIWGLSLTPGLSDLLDAGGVPLAGGTDSEGVLHEMFLVDDARIDAVRDAVAASPVVLADGHHRFETACAYRRQRVGAGADDPGVGSIMAFVVELVEEQLSIGPIHRLLRLDDAIALRDALAPRCEVEPVGPNTPDMVATLVGRMDAEDALGLVDATGVALLRPRLDAIDAELVALRPELRDVDAARCELAVLPAVPDAEVTYRDDATSTAALVEKGAADAAVLLRPVSVAQTRAAAFAGVRMPQKTTFFQPKPRTGFAFRSLDDERPA